MSPIFDSDALDFDVIIIGAGISGLNTAYRVQTELPDHQYTILEARDTLGGTWDLFRYPGIRSDTDLFTFGFPWRPWTERKLIADGDSILDYLSESVKTAQISQHIRYHHRVVSANWLTRNQKWNVSVEKSINGVAQFVQMRASLLVVGCGYYDYERPLEAEIPGLDNFKGSVIHPQFWPDKLDYTGKRMVVIGSGATAITLLPNLATKASHVTMLQRSPTYIMSLPGYSSWPHRFLPDTVVFKIRRLQFLIMPVLLWFYCRWFPESARQMFRNEAITHLGRANTDAVDKHFKPMYNPWDQRVCFAPDADFFQCIRSGKASVATGNIDSVKASSIVLRSGQEIPADIIVTATGLKLRLGGGIKLCVDDEAIVFGDKLLWRSSWLQDVPNCAFVLGYTNASWTLGADVTAHLFCRMAKVLRHERLTSVIPRLGKRKSDQDITPYLKLKSTYVQKASKDFPMTGSRGPWQGRTFYFWDLFKAKYTSIGEGLEWYRGTSVVKKMA